MGGLLFKLGRLPREEYLALEAEVRTYLDSRLGNLYRIPRYYGSKPDFGDLDIIVSSAACGDNWDALRAEIARDLKVEQTKATGAVFSTVYKNFQVDYFLANERYFEATYNYLSFNDLGNIIGRIFKRFNLKYGEKGLSYVYRREDDHYKRDIEVSLDFEQIYSFLQLDVAAWNRGFDTLDEVFEWAVQSPYFSVQPYRKQDSVVSKRSRHRTTMKRFLEWLDANNIEQEYQFNEDRDCYIPLIDQHFPACRLSAQIEAEQKREQYVTAIREKFNGQLIIQMFGLSGMQVGQFVETFKQLFGSEAKFEETLYQMPAEEVVARMRNHYATHFRKTLT